MNNNSTYRRLGDYNREVDVRNTGLKQMNYKFKDIIEEIDEFNSELKYGLDDIVGVTIEKGLIPTVANLSQTKLDGFYIVKPDTFIYNPRTHGVRLGMGYNDTDNVYITSWNNVAFRVKSKDIVLPGYLWLYFNRPEWDRHTNFLAWGSSTIVFAWRDFLDINIDLPSIEEQRRIVTRYQAIQNRIENNKKTIAKLEEAAQALYRKMFVDDVDVENLPEGWRMGTLGEVCSISAGGDKPECFSENRDKIHSIPIFANGIENDGLYGYTDKAKITLPSVTISARGTIGFVCLRTEPYVPIVRLLVCIPNKIISNSFLYLFYLLKNTKLEGDGAVQLQLTAPKFKEIEIAIPNNNLIEEFDKNISPISRIANQIKIENEKLTEMLSLVMA